MRTRLNFMRNPRHPGTALPALDAATTQKVKAVVLSDMFAIEPPVVRRCRLTLSDPR